MRSVFIGNPKAALQHMENMEKQEQPTIIVKLLQRMDTRPGFAGLGGADQTICRLIDGDVHISEMVTTILRDPALTSKLLHVANSSHNAQGLRNISTIDQVLAILGLDMVKSVASSLTLLDSLSHQSQSKQLHAEIVASFFSGRLAAEITRINGAHYSVQEAQVCGLMQNLGRMMSIFYIYEDIERSYKLQIEQNFVENDAVLQTLGLSFEDIGAAIARHWGLPDVLQNSLKPDAVKTPPQVAADSMAWHQLCSLFCRRVTEAVFRLPENREKIEIANCVNFFQKALHLNEKDILTLIESCLLEADTIQARMAFPCDVALARNFLRKASERAWDMLSPQDDLVKNGDSGNTPIDLIKHVIRHIHDHYSFDCTLICLPSGSSGLIAIAGVGRNAVKLITRFRSSGIKQNIFRVITASSHDTFISDVNSPTYANLIPDWYHDVVGARSFVMLPLMSEGKLLGMIYGDYLKSNASPPSGLAEGSMLEWRNELIHALQSGAKTFKPKIIEPFLQLIHRENKFTVDSKHPSIKMGRGKKADIVIHDSIVSRAHAKIELRRDEFVLVDFSFNGSYILIKGEAEIRLRCEEFVLRDSGSISLGHPHNEDTTEIIEFFCPG
jgi:HD-like signal output (HDOD) protein